MIESIGRDEQGFKTGKNDLSSKSSDLGSNQISKELLKDLSADVSNLNSNEVLNADLNQNSPPHSQSNLSPDFNDKLNMNFNSSAEEGLRSKTSIRMHYEAQVSVIQKQLGDLESVRLNLGLSQRKMAQLLMVDPSSWTRWTRQGDEAPPHIWRALQWFMVLQEKIPGLTPQYFISQSPQVFHQKALQELENERSERQSELLILHQKISGLAAERGGLQSELNDLKKELKFHKKMSIVISLISLIFIALLWAQKS